jgi:hypothetical protein
MKKNRNKIQGRCHVPRHYPLPKPVRSRTAIKAGGQVSRAKNFSFSQSKSRTSGNKAGSAVVLVSGAQNRDWRLSKTVAGSFLEANGYFL